MKNNLSIYTGLSVIALGAPLTSIGQNQHQQPNIVFILSDDHSYPYLGCYGNPDLKTPNIDKIAAEGILYHSAYTTAPQSVPSRASLMTGRNDLDIEMSRFSAPLQRKHIAFPEVMRENGYYTGICGRSYHLDGSDTKAPETEETFKKYNLETFKDRVDYLRKGSDSLAIVQYKEFLDEVPKGKPFFIQVNFHDPHRPFTAKEYEPNPATLHMPATMPDSKEFREDLAGYYGEINRLDENVGLVLKEIERRKLKNTIIVFMGDNGSALLRGKGTLYDCGLHVPLMIKWEGKIKKGQQSYSLFSGEDFAPTLLDMAGIPLPDYYTGKSFVPTFSNPDYVVRNEVYAIRASHGSSLPWATDDFDLMRTIFTKDYKLIYNILWQEQYYPVDFVNMPAWKYMEAQHEKGTLDPKFEKAIFPGKRPMFELYDLRNDPDEFVNLAGNPGYKEIEHDLKAKLHEWMIVYHDYVPLPIETMKRK